MPPAKPDVEKKPKRKITLEKEPKRKITLEKEPKRKIVIEDANMVEEDEAIKVAIVHKVCLQKFKHESKTYYLDSERDKLYEYVAEKKHGMYIGRWDSLLQEIVAGEDSDIE